MHMLEALEVARARQEKIEALIAKLEPEHLDALSAAEWSDDFAVKTRGHLGELLGIVRALKDCQKN